MALQVGELFASFNLDTSGLDGACSEAEQKLSNIGKGMVFTGGAMAAAVTAPIVKAAKAIYQSGTEFDAQMSKVFAISKLDKNVSADVAVMQQLNDKALEMGSTTAFTAKQAGEAFEKMAMAGWDVNAMMGGIEPILNLAAASGEDLGRTSDIVTDAMTAMGYTIGSVGGDVDKFNDLTTYFSDVLAATATSSNTDVGMMGETFKNAGAYAGMLGYSIEDTALAIGMMANAGIKSADAGTAIRRGLQMLATPNKAATEAMKKYGIQLYNSAGEARPLRDVMTDLRENLKGLSTEEKAAAMEAMFGKNAMTGWLSIINGSDEDFNRLSNALSNVDGSAKKMAETMLDNAAGDMTLFKSALEGLEIDLWHLVEGGFRELVQGATQMVLAFQDMDDQLQIGTLKMAGLAAAAGPVIAATGALIQAFPAIATAIAGLTSPIELLTLGLLALSVAAIDDSNAIGETLVAGMEAASSKLASLAESFATQLPIIEERMSNFLGSLGTAFAENMPSILESLGSMIASAMTAIADTASDIGETAVQIVQSFADGISGALSLIIPAAVNLVSSLVAETIKAAPQMLKAGAKIVKALMDGILAADWFGAGAKIGDAIRSALDGIGKEIFENVFGEDAVDKMGDWNALGKQLIDNLKNALFGDVPEGMEKEAADQYTQLGNQIIDKIFEGIKNAVDTGTDFVGGVIEGLANLFSDANIDAASDSLSEMTGRILQRAFEEIPHLTDKAGTLLEKLGELILGGEDSKGLASSALEGAKKLAESIMNAVAEGLPGVTDAGQKFASKLGEMLQGVPWSDYATSLSGIGEALITMIAEAIKGASTLAGSVIEALGSLFKEGGAVQNFATAAGALAKDLIAAITSEIPGVKDAAVNIIKKLGNLFSGNNVSTLLDGAKNIAGDIIGAIIQSIPDVTDAAVDILDAIGSLFTPDNAESFTDAFKHLLETLFEQMPGIIEGLGQSASKIIDAIGKALFGTGEGDGLVPFGETALTGLLETILGNIGPIVETMGKQAGDILRSIGTALFGNAEQEGAVSVGVSALTDLLSTIFKELNTSVIPGLADFVSNMIDAFGDLFTGDNAGKLLTSLQGLFANVLNGLKTTIPNLADKAAGIMNDLINTLFSTDEAGNKGLVETIANTVGSLATALGTQLSEAIKSIGESDKSQWIEAMGSLIDGMINALPSLLDAGGNIISAGAKIAKSIFDSIASALSDIDKSGLKDKIGNAAQKLVKQLLTSLEDLSGNPDIKGFIESLGAAIEAGLGALGDIAGKIVGQIFSAEGLTSLYNAGVNIGKMLLSGIQSILNGLSSFVDNLVENALVGVGVIDPAARNSLKSAATEAGGIISNYAMNGITEGEKGAGNIMAAALLGAGLETIGFGNQVRQIYKKSGYEKELLSASQYLLMGFHKALLSNSAEGFAQEIENSFTGAGYDLDLFQGKFWDDQTRQLWSNFRDAWKAGTAMFASDEARQTAIESLVNLVNGLFGSDQLGQAMQQGAQGLTDKTAEALAAASASGIPVTGGTTDLTDAQASADALGNQLESMYEQASEQGAQGIVSGIKAGGSEASTAAAAVSAEVVQTFLEGMSADQGSTIGQQFGAGVASGLSGTASNARSAAGAVGAAAISSLQSMASASIGFSIGANFGAGFANGIASAEGAVSAAASGLGSISTGALSSAIQEGSPSKITKKSGRNFGLGYQIGIQNTIGDVAKVVKDLGDVSIYELNTRGGNGNTDVSFGGLFGAAAQFTSGALYGSSGDFSQGKSAIESAADDIIDAVTGAAEISSKATAEVYSGISKLEQTKKGGPVYDSDFWYDFMMQDQFDHIREAQSEIARKMAEASGIAETIMHKTVGAIGGTFAEETYIPSRRYITPGGEYVNASNDVIPAIEKLGGLIVDALGEIQVNMDGEAVGHLVSGAVSDDIAYRMASRRSAAIV